MGSNLMALKPGTVTWNYPGTSPIVREAVGLHRFGRGVTDFVRKLHENTIKARPTAHTFLAWWGKKNLGFQIFIFISRLKVRRAGSDVVCPVRKCAGKHLGG